MSESVRSVRGTLRELRRLPVSMHYLMLWMVFSDGVFVIGTIGAAGAKWSGQSRTVPHTHITVPHRAAQVVCMQTVKCNGAACPSPLVC